MPFHHDEPYLGAIPPGEDPLMWITNHSLAQVLLHLLPHLLHHSISPISPHLLILPPPLLLSQAMRQLVSLLQQADSVFSSLEVGCQSFFLNYRKTCVVICIKQKYETGNWWSREAQNSKRNFTLL